MTPIKYVGRRANFVDRIYGTGAAFAVGQTVIVDDDAVARKMLRHVDVYVLGESAGAHEAPAMSAKKKGVTEDDQDQIDRDAIAIMGKDALTSFAMTHFSVTLDKRMSVDNMRARVTGLVDQFGLD